MGKSVEMSIFPHLELHTTQLGNGCGPWSFSLSMLEIDFEIVLSKQYLPQFCTRPQHKLLDKI